MLFEEEILFEDEDERRKFFINPSKKGKIAKRLSFGNELRLDRAPNLNKAYPSKAHPAWPSILSFIIVAQIIQVYSVYA